MRDLGCQFAYPSRQDQRKSYNPAQWWAQWLFGRSVSLKDLQDPGTLLGGLTSDQNRDKFKLGIYYIARHLFPGVTLGGGGHLDDPNAYLYTGNVRRDIVVTNRNQRADGPLTPYWFLLLSSALNLVPTLLAFAVPAIASVTLFLSIYFLQFLVMVGCDLAFRVLMALGLAMIPLVFFGRFYDVWRHYLIGLICTAMVPWLFFVCAGIGFSFIPVPYDPLPSAFFGRKKQSFSAVLLGLLDVF
ncbi:hypothetical protein [Candidatus Methylacidithermus pantelleriae]|uniref:Uncharacterized protein n=1 Tax=Candidatus Methylacidithermus pantelleriae TaxID=2744239 RepID=A0A8J2BKC1_9BACT|nr:hypothetical protein [Candidatus Methylacidithermus pantelleriae]CAF0699855.1 membrane hypothetical protein [Candidatus Methylacidithermus pantelleriae]